MSDHLDPSPSPQIAPPRGRTRLVAGGVASALALGVGLGLWARPAPLAEPIAGIVLRPDPAPASLQIVFEDTPAPLGPLLEVLSDEVADAEAAPAPRPEIVPPDRPAAGLMKVDAVVAAAPLLLPTIKVQAPPAEALDKPPHRSRAPEPARPDKAKVAAKPKPDVQKLADAKPKPGTKARAKTMTKDKALKAPKLAKAEAVRADKAAKAKALKLAQADAKREKAAKAKAEARRTASLVKTLKAAPKVAKAEIKKTRVQLAQAKDRKAPKAEKPSKALVVAKAAPKQSAAKPSAKRPAPVGHGPLRVARNDACSMGQAGCGDRRLDARDRQLQRAYRNAEAAGVPTSALQRQQARWLQARAAAAREAPWAVEDVYEARISELNDLTRDAREN